MQDASRQDPSRHSTPTKSTPTTSTQGQSATNTDPVRVGKGFYVAGVIIALVVAGLALFISVSRRSGNTEEAQRLQQENALGPHVRVGLVTHTPAIDSITLEGEARPYLSVTLYAKVSGYLKTIRVDKGDDVREGEVIATIESPETDRAYQAAQADAVNKKHRAERNKALLAQQLVSNQDAEQSEADAEVAAQNVAALATQKGYEVLRAPFSGKVTARFADRGALVQNAANSQTSALPIVTIAQVDHLRLYIYLDQESAQFVKVGQPVSVRVPERPGFSVQANVARVAGALDPKTKLLLVEIDLPNKNGNILAGSTVEVTLGIKRPEMLLAPSAALVVRKAKFFLPVISNDDHVHFQEVRIGANDGENVEVLSGVKEGDRVALNLGDLVADSSHVQIVKPPTAK